MYKAFKRQPAFFSNVERIGSIFFKHGKLGMQQNLFVFFFAQERARAREREEKFSFFLQL